MTDPMALYDVEWEHRRAVHPKWPLPDFSSDWASEFDDSGCDCG